MLAIVLAVCELFVWSDWKIHETRQSLESRRSTRNQALVHVFGASLCLRMNSRMTLCIRDLASCVAWQGSADSIKSERTTTRETLTNSRSIIPLLHQGLTSM